MTRTPGGNKRAMQRIGAIVDQGLTRECGQRAAGFVHQKIGSRKVPVVAVVRREGQIERARRRRARAAARARTPSVPRRDPARASASRSSIGFGPAAVMPSRLAPAICRNGSAVERRRPRRPPQGKARPAPARRSRAITGRPFSTSATEIDQSVRPDEIGARAVDRVDDPQARRVQAARDRPRSPPRASRNPAQAASAARAGNCRPRCRLRSPASRRVLVQLFERGLERALRASAPASRTAASSRGLQRRV